MRRPPSTSARARSLVPVAAAAASSSARNAVPGQAGAAGSPRARRTLSSRSAASGCPMGTTRTRSSSKSGCDRDVGSRRREVRTARSTWPVAAERRAWWSWTRRRRGGAGDTAADDAHQLGHEPPGSCADDPDPDRSRDVVGEGDDIREQGVQLRLHPPGAGNDSSPASVRWPFVRSTSSQPSSRSSFFT